MRSKAYYAAIDLGSNSFHMLVVRVVAGGVQIVSKIKRKVRLAAGLQADGSLDPAAKARALECLRIFADRVQDIDPTHIRAVGTATLRKIAHDTAFIEQAQQTLGHPIDIISGEEEAATIYQGIAHTTAFTERMLVIDIGGASTELVLGQGFTASVLNSLDMGCVTMYQAYFADGQINPTNTSAAISHARQIVEAVAAQYTDAGQGLVLGASGTFKALQEIAEARGEPLTFEQSWLYQRLDEAIACIDHSHLQIQGLQESRQAVFVSGLCVLLGICQALNIQSLQATSGALREGIIYALLHDQALPEADVQLRTLKTLASTYHLDEAQAQRVQQMATQFVTQATAWELPLNSQELIRATAYLHELGLSLAYKQASSHASYMVQHLDMPGFNGQLRSQLRQMLTACAGIIDDDKRPELSADAAMQHLERLVRLAIIVCQRRCDASLTDYQLDIQGDILTLQASAQFWASNPFLSSLLTDECELTNAAEPLVAERPA